MFSVMFYEKSGTYFEIGFIVFMLSLKYFRMQEYFCKYNIINVLCFKCSAFLVSATYKETKN